MAVEHVPDPPQITGLNFVRPLGSGGFAQVHLYAQDMPSRNVAVKVLNESLFNAQNASASRREFESEADVMAQLSAHPAIVSIYQAGVALDGRPYLAMEFCPESMWKRTKGKGADIKTVLDAGIRLAGALESAHRSGVFHRDIKPANVLITTTGNPALTDFGIASAGNTPLGDAQGLAMSVPWAAPEVVNLETQGTVATEIWSLGATLYSFAVGRSPFASTTGEKDSRRKLIERINRNPAPAIQGDERFGPLNEVLAATMSKDPNARYQSMQQLGEALQYLQRMFGFDVTPLEVTSSDWMPRTQVAALTNPAAEPAPARGPVVSQVAGHRSRAEKRAAAQQALATDKDGLIIEDRPSATRYILIGAGVALGVAAIVGVSIWLLTGGLS